MNENNFTPEFIVNNASASSQPNHYVIRVKGILGPDWEWLEGFTVTYLEPGETIISGSLEDQAALHGLLARIRDLNLTLLSVNQIEPDDL